MIAKSINNEKSIEIKQKNGSMRLVAEMKKVWESKARAEKKILMADEILGSIILVKATEKRLTITAAPRSDEKQTRQKERKMKENAKEQKKRKTRGTKESNEKSVMCVQRSRRRERERKDNCRAFSPNYDAISERTPCPNVQAPTSNPEKRNKLVQVQY